MEKPYLKANHQKRIIECLCGNSIELTETRSSITETTCDCGRFYETEAHIEFVDSTD
jgi:hypothetical protein